MKEFTNHSQIPISLAVWLCDDDYDHNDDPMAISATSLLKPMQALILARRNRDLTKVADVESLIPSRMGTALHTAIENTWNNPDKVTKILLALGYSPTVVSKILINPEKEQILTDSVCIYMEQRRSKQVGKYSISGKFDFVIEGTLEDFKSTGTYGYISGSNTEKYRQQGSIYRWLNPDIITQDYMRIQFIFTDWSKMKARTEAGYPQKRLLEQKIPLMSIAETEAFVTGIVNDVAWYESDEAIPLPLCSDEELWRSATVFKYYKDPAKKARSTKNFDNAEDAQIRLHKDGSIGEVVIHPGQVKRCGYCDVIGICPQAKALVESGALVL